MKDQHPRSDDVLSAFLDGEASPQERAEVERRLETSPAARQELSELRAVSELVQDLPRQTLPGEFAAQVMQAAERRMLLPERQPAVATPVSSRRRLYGIAAAIAATAAGLMLAMQYNDQRPAGQGPAVANNDKPQVLPKEPATVPNWQGDVTPAEPKKESRAVEVATKSPTESTAPGRISRPPGRPLANRPSPRPDELAPGQVVEALDTSGGTITVVKLVAVDRVPGFSVLQKVLTDNAIPADSAESASAKPGEKEALYVEATRDQLVVALREMQKAGFVVDPKNIEQLRVDQLDAPAREAIAHRSGSTTPEANRQRVVNIPAAALQARSGSKPAPSAGQNKVAPVQVLFVVEQKPNQSSPRPAGKPTATDGST